MAMETTRYSRAPKFEEVAARLMRWFGNEDGGEELVRAPNSVVRLPRMKSASATLLLPAVSTISTRASAPATDGTPSAASGRYLMKLPPRVPAFWITPPISRAAALSKPSKSDGGRSASARSLKMVVVPMRHARLPSSRMPRRLAIALMSRMSSARGSLEG